MLTQKKAEKLMIPNCKERIKIEMNLKLHNSLNVNILCFFSNYLKGKISD